MAAAYTFQQHGIIFNVNNISSKGSRQEMFAISIRATIDISALCCLLKYHSLLLNECLLDVTFPRGPILGILD
jgi:hypothetical protein